MTDSIREIDVLVVGASLSAAACAKRLVDAGLETVVLDRKKLPRHKICSGILSPRGHRFLIENFGPLPREILHEPTSCRGVTFHFPSLLQMSMDFDHGPTPHLHRKYSDYWAIKRSGVEIHDQTSFVSLKDTEDGVDVVAQVNPEAEEHAGETRHYRARFIIGADGPDSRVVKAVYPDYTAQIPWFLVGQKFHEILECPLDPDYFHFWFHPQLGHYTWSHARDGRQIVGVGFPKGGNFNHYHQNVVDYLAQKHGVRLGPALEPEGCVENFGPSLINRYIFGKGNVLITGQAAGFLNMMAEGMSVALHSGAIAGEAVIEALQQNRPLQEMYRIMIASEVRHCSDQWNPLKIVFGRPHEADFRARLKTLCFRDQVRLVAGLLRFIRIYGRFKWGRQMLGQAWRRLFKDGYDPARWL
jgi:flavin-dependent dehydrogenase